MSRPTAGAASLLLAMLTPPTVAGAAQIQFCVKHDAATFTDSGQAGEDFWTSNVAREPRGAFFEVYKQNTADPDPLFASYLGDGIGADDPGLACTPVLTVLAVNGTYDLTVSSYGIVNSVNLDVRDGQSSFWAASKTVTLSNGQTVQPVTIQVQAGTGFNVLNVYQAAAYALYRHNGATGGQTYDIYVDTAVNLGSINLPTGTSWKKFIIVHEMAHRMVALRAPNMKGAIDYTIQNDPQCPEESANKHSMRSEEYVGSAANEGFSHFYAADVWNSHSEGDCWFEYYKTVLGDPTPQVDCQTGDGGTFALRRYETVCSPPPTLGGHGVELDWMRAFWDVHTRGAAPDPTFFDVMNWLEAGEAYPWSNSSGYYALDSAADDYGGEVLSNWNWTVGDNGIAH